MNDTATQTAPDAGATQSADQAAAALAAQQAQTQSPQPKPAKGPAKWAERNHERMFRRPDDEKKGEKDEQLGKGESEKGGRKEGEKTDGAKEKTAAAAKEKETDGKPEKAKRAALKPVAKAEAPKQPPVDLKELVRSTVEATAQAVRTEKAPDGKTDLGEVPRERKGDLDAIAAAEEHGLIHKGAAVQAAERFRAERAYIDAWERDHPGEEFDPESGEHDKWYAKNVPPWMEQAAETGKTAAAEAKLKKSLREELEKELVSPLRAELSQAQLREQEREAAALAPRLVADGIGSALRAINPDFLKEGVNVAEVDPVAHDIMLRVGPQIAADTQAAVLLLATRGASLPAGDTQRERIIATTTALEKRFEERTEEELTDPQGRTFVPLDKWAGLSHVEQKKHWTITGELVAMELAALGAAKAKELYDAENARLEKLAQARGWTKTGVAGKARNGTAPNAEEEVIESGKPRSPSTAAQTVSQPGVKVEPKVARNGGDRLYQSIFRR